MLPFLLIIIPTLIEKQIAEQPSFLNGTADAYTTDFLFISSPYGIYTFDSTTETWGRITHLNGLPDNDITIMGIDEGILWVATKTGLASADVRIHDWVTYDLPGNVHALAFDDDYTWVGGDFGIERFDKYVESWEHISDISALDIFSDEDYLWIATDSGVARYDYEFERVEFVTAAPRSSFTRIIGTQQKLWFIAHDKFVSYIPSIEQWASYDGFAITDYTTVGDSIFVIHEGLIHLYDPAGDHWVRFRDIDESIKMNGIFALGTQHNLLCATDNGLLIYDWDNRTRSIYNRSNGLVNDTIIDAYQQASYLFIVEPHTIEFMNTDVGLWKSEPLEMSGPKRKKLFFVDDAGGHLALIKSIDMRLQGRAYYSRTMYYTDSQTVTDYENINMKFIAQHTSNRLLSLYYDDTDKDQVNYGVGYRGLNRDIIYRCNGGYLTSQYYEFDLIPEFYTFGADAKLKIDDHALYVQGGKLQSELQNDFFYGRTIVKHDTIRDVDYQNNNFYYIYQAEMTIERDFDSIFVDDGLSSTNTLATRVNASFAGVTGDFDPFVNGLDYFIDYEHGIIHFLSRRRDTDIIVLLLNGQEIVIQSQSTTARKLVNTYVLGPGIIPNTLSLEIRDTLGIVYPLSDFGIDENNDGSVDPDYINYNLGYLRFPGALPFPAPVYDDTVNIYSMDVQFLSQSVFYRLNVWPILVGSEQVFVDGERMVRGFHYILDYEYGRLLFLQEEVISDFSEIEVAYSSVERDRQTVFVAAQPDIHFGQRMAVAPGYTYIDDLHIYHISSKVQLGDGESKTLKFVPQIATTDDKEWAQKYEIVANYNRMSMNATYRHYSPHYETFGASEMKYGSLRQGGSISATIEPFNYVRLDGTYKKNTQTDTLGAQHTVQHAFGKINYLNPTLPNGSLLIGQDLLPDYKKERIRITTNYDTRFLRTKAKFNSTFRAIDMTIHGEDNKRVLEGILNTTVSLPVPIHTEIYLRQNNVYSAAIKEKQENELRGTMGIDILPGLYYTGNYDLQFTTHYFEIAKDVLMRQYFYSNLNIAPGRWLPRLSIVNLACGIGNNFDEYIQNLPSSYSIPYFILKPLLNVNLSNITSTNTYYLTIQLLPWTNLLLWGKHTLIKSGHAYYGLPPYTNTMRDEIRIEFEPKYAGLFITAWDFRRTISFPITSTHTLYVEWSKPWSTLFRTKYTMQSLLRTEDFGIARRDDYEIRTTVETLLRFNNQSFLTFYIAGIKQRNMLDEVTYLFTPGGGLNYYLLRFLYIQCDYEMTRILDGETSHLLSVKLTNKF